ncbi:MAG: hypothetical protein LC808_44815 [Actinobacteria bacterium]|nr:hypothetical protein [Actinomycetota bacterium]
MSTRRPGIEPTCQNNQAIDVIGAGVGSGPKSTRQLPCPKGVEPAHAPRRWCRLPEELVIREFSPGALKRELLDAIHHLEEDV